MIGGLLGIGMVLNYLGAAWSGPGAEGNLFDSGFLSGLVAIAILCLIGVFLFPRTVGIAFTGTSFVSPIAFVLGWISSGFVYGLVMLGFGVAAWAVTFIIGIVRPEST
jgi:uncharacterized membrane protein